MTEQNTNDKHAIIYEVPGGSDRMVGLLSVLACGMAALQAAEENPVLLQAWCVRIGIPPLEPGEIKQSVTTRAAFSSLFIGGSGLQVTAADKAASDRILRETGVEEMIKDAIRTGMN